MEFNSGVKGLTAGNGSRLAYLVLGLLLAASAVTQLPRYITAMKLAYPEPAESRSHHVPKPYLHIHPSVTKTASF